ncbi:tetrahydromethanopterin S-methyltransferase subunit G [Psychrobacter sp. PL15]|uniref:hypothetical protein n=1 Tax=unclassified Psychrobacter TaxID=196806 RepID=UPI001AE12DC8|nr:hypothetical protein [Psychrobacter sp. PL15]MEC5211411.1 tetrahydromethanopterin S-methyltransferase subunit G [Psychrobacter sp. PL15]
MNDSDNNTDDRIGLSTATHTKPSGNARTSDVCERFIDRVDDIDNDRNLDIDNLKSLDEFKKSSSYELLNEEELLLFTNHEQEEQELDPKIPETISLDITSSDNDKAIATMLHTLVDDNEIKNLLVDDQPKYDNSHLLTNEPIADSSNKETGTLFGKQISSSKLLIVGMVSGLILSAVIILLLNTIGILSVAEDRLAYDNSNTMPISAPAANTEQSTGIEENKVAASTSDTQVISEPVLNKNSSVNTASVDNYVSIDDADKSDLTPKPVLAALNKEESNITYEDFREEAQDTLYRDDKN